MLFSNLTYIFTYVSWTLVLIVLDRCKIFFIFFLFFLFFLFFFFFSFTGVVVYQNYLIELDPNMVTEEYVVIKERTRGSNIKLMVGFMEFHLLLVSQQLLVALNYLIQKIMQVLQQENFFKKTFFP